MVPLAEQDRGRWNRVLIDEGVRLITRTLRRAPLGPYQVQAAIAAIHADAARAEDQRYLDDRAARLTREPYPAPWQPGVTSG